jgi:hypothetical protein
MASSEPETPAGAGRDEDRPVYPSHFRPRTKAGWLAVVAFLALFALTQPPLLYVLANRINPWVLGLPFLYAYLLALYVLLIAVLIWARRRDL